MSLHSNQTPQTPDIYCQILKLTVGVKNFELFPFCLGEKREVKSIFGHGTGVSLLKGWANVPETHSNLTFVNTADNIFENGVPKKAFYGGYRRSRVLIS